jgi:hypothetical protein
MVAQMIPTVGAVVVMVFTVTVPMGRGTLLPHQVIIMFAFLFL